MRKTTENNNKTQNTKSCGRSSEKNVKNCGGKGCGKNTKNSK